MQSVGNFLSVSLSVCLPMSPSSGCVNVMWAEVEEWERQITSKTSLRHKVSNHANLISYVTRMWLVKLEVLQQ